ncbi:uncharacterized protein A4U43_C07F25940 [Asparagus officinalis]|uniref:NAC domain-containing protein n=1 Tax=Asparagus officinalis TaxID=4686 RepID=A0A5P1EHU7_ASPOF|nr:NAC transcription factor 32-like [Asparagus officinalis]ONK64439.1 uncharacterized protein A4U43_C07F25940 [Asparagus officinalis]
MALVAVGDQQEYFFDVGFKFKPTDVEILDHYVRRRFSGSPEPNFLIKSEEVYAYKPWKPSEAPSVSVQQEMYFFTLRRPASKKRVSRRVDEGGKWDCKVAEKAIYKQEVRDGKKVNVLVGYRNQLSFRDAEKRKMHDQWIMHEYRVDESVLGFRSEIQDKLVFCKIYKKKEYIGEGEGGEEEEERCAKRQRVCPENYESTANGIPPPAAETPSSSTGGAHSETSSSSSPIPLAAVDYGASYSNYLIDDHLQCPEFDPVISLDDFELSAAALALPAAETSPSACIVSPISRLMDGTHDEHEFASASVAANVKNEPDADQTSTASLEVVLASAAEDDDDAFYAKLSEEFNVAHPEIANLAEDYPADVITLYPDARDFVPIEYFDDYFTANEDRHLDQTFLFQSSIY